MNTLSVFDFGEESVRTVIDESGEVWFIAKDVTKILGYENSSRTIRDHCKKAKSLNSLAYTVSVETLPGNTLVISESDVLRLVIKSRLPAAEKFENWVFEEVLPQIRKTGSFSAENLTPAEFLLHNAQMLVTHERKLMSLELEQKRLKKSELETKSHITALLDGEGYYTVSGFANLHGIKVTEDDARVMGKQVSAFCREKGWRIGSAHSPKYGNINTYPKEALEEFLEDDEN